MILRFSKLDPRNRQNQKWIHLNAITLGILTELFSFFACRERLLTNFKMVNTFKRNVLLNIKIILLIYFINFCYSLKKWSVHDHFVKVTMLPGEPRKVREFENWPKSQGISFSHSSGNPDFLLQVYKQF